MRFLYITASLFMFSIGCSASSKYPVTEHYDGKIFHNQSGNSPKSLKDLLKWWSEDSADWPDKVELEPQKPLVKNLPDDEIHISFINHASFLIRSKEWSLMTDPHFTKRASPVSFAGPKRVHAPGVQLSDVRKLDYVFISHNHYDHLDIPSLKQIKKKFPDVEYLVPLGNERLLQSKGMKKTLSADWWQKFKDSGAEFYLVPAEHWSARGLFDRNENLWGGLVIKWKKRMIYFAGDTGYGIHYKQIREKLGEPDIALLPIGAYEPRWFMKKQHMNPADSVQAHLDLKADMSVGMHLGCFQLTNEAIDQPVKDLEAAKTRSRLKPDDFIVLKPGQTLILKL